MSKSSSSHESAEQHVKNIRRATRKQYSAEEKIRIVLEGLRGEYSIAELCRRVLELEAKLRAASGSGVTLTSNPTLAAWRKIQEGMTWREVRAVLGEPKTIDGGNIESWYYSNSLNHSNVRFLDGRVRWWNEPR